MLFILVTGTIGFMFFKQLSLRAIVWETQGYSEDEITMMSRKSILKLVIFYILFTGLTVYNFSEVRKSAPDPDECLGRNFKLNHFIAVQLGIITFYTSLYR
eukprot:UN04655